MKVIIIKDCKDGKVNEVIDVATGYATNFLIKNKLALPFNAKTNLMLKNKLASLEAEEEAKRLEATELKYELEKLDLKFKLKETNNVIHGSISAKKVAKAVEEKGFKLPKHSLEEHLHITSLGITELKTRVYKDIFATLKIKVIKDE